MGGQEDRGAAQPVLLQNELPDLELRHRVQADGGLVQKQDFGSVEQGGGDLAPHPLAQGQHPGRGLQEVTQVQQGRQTVHILPELRRRDPVDVPQKVEGLHDGHVPPQLAALAEDYAQPGHVPLPVLPGHQPVHGAFPAVGPEDAAEDLDGGAFPRAVGTDVA